jgi:hypothetical protein
MTLGLFLIDTFCLGIKDAVVRMIGSEEFGTYVEAMEGTVPLVPVDPSYARKLVREAAAWAQSIGFPPHRDFAVAEQLFGDTDANACDANFPFGQDGKPFYVPGPSESTALIRRRMAQLRTTGEGNFLIGIPEEMARSTFVARPPPEALDDLQEDHDEADDGDAPGGGA